MKAVTSWPAAARIFKYGAPVAHRAGEHVAAPARAPALARLCCRGRGQRLRQRLRSRASLPPISPRLHARREVAQRRARSGTTFQRTFRSLPPTRSSISMAWRWESRATPLRQLRCSSVFRGAITLVHTAFALAAPGRPGWTEERATTRVRFYPLRDDEIAEYVAPASRSTKPEPMEFKGGPLR